MDVQCKLSSKCRRLVTCTKLNMIKLKVAVLILKSIYRDTPLANIEGHEKRVSRVAYHPSGRFLASCW